MKIIRIHNDLHAEFKKMCRIQKVTLTKGTEILVQSALKKGTFQEVDKSVFKKLQEIENLFRSWMRKQEKEHIGGLAEDLLSLSRNLNNLANKNELNEALVKSRNDLREMISTSQSRIDQENKELIKRYERLARANDAFKDKLLRKIKLAGKYFLVGSIILTSVILTINLWSAKSDSGIKYRLLEYRYETLYRYCQDVEKEFDIQFLNNYDQWMDTTIVQYESNLIQKQHVHQSH